MTSAVGEFDASAQRLLPEPHDREGERYSSLAAIGVETSIAGLNADALRRHHPHRQAALHLFAGRPAEVAAGHGVRGDLAGLRLRRRASASSTATWPTSPFNVTYLVDEGARVYVERINITGNEKTRDA